MTTETDSRLKLIGRREVLAAVGKSYPTIWNWMREGKFPRSVAIGGGIAWYEHEVQEFLANLKRQTLKGDVA